MQAVSSGVTDFLSVAIAADLESEFVGPCGMCRSVYNLLVPTLHEYPFNDVADRPWQSSILT